MLPSPSNRPAAQAMLCTLSLVIVRSCDCTAWLLEGLRTLSPVAFQHPAAQIVSRRVQVILCGFDRGVAGELLRRVQIAGLAPDPVQRRMAELVERETVDVGTVAA